MIEETFVGTAQVVEAGFAVRRADEAVLGAFAVAELAGPSFTLTAIVRTNDPFLTVTGLSSTTLGTWTNLPVNPLGTPSGNQTGVSSGCERRDFSISIGSETKIFLRLEITDSSP